MARAMTGMFGGALLLSISCGDAQTTPAYQGEPLMNIWGSITNADGQPIDPQLVPVVGWVQWSDLPETYYLRGVEVEGTFPADFRLSILQPPPDEVVVTSPASGERYAFGFLFAAKRGYPDSEVQHSATRFDEYFRPDGSGRVERLYEWCDANGACVRETYDCPSFGNTVEPCAFASSVADNADVKAPGWWSGGIAEDIAIVYVPDGVTAGSPLSAAVAARHALSPGMHLVHYRWPSAQEVNDVILPCMDRAHDLVVHRYNEAHGTTFAAYEELRKTLEGTPGYHDLFRDLDQANAELSCQSGRIVTPIETLASTPLELRLGSYDHAQPPRLF